MCSIRKREDRCQVAYYFCSMLKRGPTIWILAGALRLNQFLNSTALKLVPPTTTDVVFPDPKSTDTLAPDPFSIGLPPLFLSSDLTVSIPHVSLPAGLDLSVC